MYAHRYRVWYLSAAQGRFASEEGRQTIHRTGTYCSVIDWDQLENGLLGITVEGQAKFRITDCWQGDNVLEATVAFSEQDRLGKEAIPVDDTYAELVGLLPSLEKHPLVEQKMLTIDYDNLWELGWRLGEFIPIAVDQKQQMLTLMILGNESAPMNASGRNGGELTLTGYP